MTHRSSTTENGSIRTEHCEHCATAFDPEGTIAATFPGLPSLFRCPECGQWTEEAP